MLLRTPERSFLDADVVLDLARVQTPYAFVGIPFGPPYVPEDLCVCAGAADAVRAVTHRMAYRAISQHHDFDLAGPLFPGGQPSVTDCGDVVGDVRDPDRIWEIGVGVLTSIVRRGAMPLVVGGLDAIPPITLTYGIGYAAIPHLAAWADLGMRATRSLTMPNAPALVGGTGFTEAPA